MASQQTNSGNVRDQLGSPVLEASSLRFQIFGCKYVCVCVCVYVCMYVMYVRTCTYLCMYACMYALHVCMHITAFASISSLALEIEVLSFAVNRPERKQKNTQNTTKST